MKGLSNRQKILLIAFAVGLGGFLLFKGIRVSSSGDFFNLVGIGLGALGAILAVWQVVLALGAASDAKESTLQATLDGIRRESDERDRLHEQQLADINARLESVSTQIQMHQTGLGHDGTISQILNIKDTLSDLRVAIAATTRHGELLQRLEAMEAEVEKLKTNYERDA